MGVRVTVLVQPSGYDSDLARTQNYGSAELFDGTQWHAVAGLPPQLMKSLEFTGTRFRYNAEGVEEDVRTLLSDVRTALELRALGPGEYAKITHDPGGDPRGF